jgi:hypothetical protein
VIAAGQTPGPLEPHGTEHIHTLDRMGGQWCCCGCRKHAKHHNGLRQALGLGVTQHQPCQTNTTCCRGVQHRCCSCKEVIHNDSINQSHARCINHLLCDLADSTCCSPCVAVGKQEATTYKNRDPPTPQNLQKHLQCIEMLMKSCTECKSGYTHRHTHSCNTQSIDKYVCKQHVHKSRGLKASAQTQSSTVSQQAA